MEPAPISLIEADTNLVARVVYGDPAYEWNDYSYEDAKDDWDIIHRSLEHYKMGGS